MTLDVIREPAAPANVLPPERISYQEIHHRVSNSLQLISSLLSVQARQAGDVSVRDALEVAIQRISAVGTLHRQLCRSSSPRAINIAGYLFDLAETIEQSFGGSIPQKHISAHVQRQLVSPNFACVLGMLITELVINACKHAYAPDEPGDIEICLFFPTKSEFRMEVRDYGGEKGRGGSIKSPGLGKGIIDAMCRRLDATYEFLADGEGTRFLTKGVVF